MTSTPLHFQTITELSRQLRSGGLSPVDLTEHCLSRLEALEPTLHAFRLPTPERARAAAQAAEIALRAGQDLGPLHGIPYAVKDLFDPIAHRLIDTRFRPTQSVHRSSPRSGPRDQYP